MTVQLELMRPEQADQARDAFPVAYIPLGALEFHGRQNPVGLDAIKCHRLLIRLAERIGGLVVPPVFYGHGSGHVGFPWTWMLDSTESLKAILRTTIKGLEQNGIKVVVLMSGHYPNEEVMREIAVERRDSGGKARVLVMMEYDAFEPKGEWHGDHAAKWETSYMMALGGELVDPSQILKSPSGKTVEDFVPTRPHQPGGWWFEKREDHPWYGLAAYEGNDVRMASAELGTAAIDRVIAWAAGKVRAELALA